MADTQVLQQIKWNFRRSLAWLRADKGGSCCWKCNLAPPGKGCYGWRCPPTLPRSIRRLISNRGKKTHSILINRTECIDLKNFSTFFPPVLAELDVLWDTLHTLLMIEAVTTHLIFSISFSTVSYTHSYAQFVKDHEIFSDWCSYVWVRSFRLLKEPLWMCLCVFCRSEGISWSALLYRDTYNVTTPCPVLLIKWHGKVSWALYFHLFVYFSPLSRGVSRDLWLEWLL